LKNHVLPTLGKTRVRDITRSEIRDLLQSKRAAGSSLQGQKGDSRTPRATLKKNSVKQILFVVSSVLSLAVDEETIGSNPALGVTRQRRTKAPRRDARARAGETIKALTRDQRNTFLATAEHEEPEAFPAFMLMTLGGLRLGEALGLKWPSVDFVAKRMEVKEQIGSDSMTVGVYGSWFAVEASGAMDRLAAGIPLGQPVTKQGLPVTTTDPSSAEVLPPTGTCGSGGTTRPFPA
jgi:integrase